MAISATSSGAAVASTIRSQYQEQFAKLKQAYQETGSIAGVETSYKSDDGNVAISLRGYKTADGRQAVDVQFNADGAEGIALQRLLDGGIDNATGRPYAPDTRFGGTGMNASGVVESAADFDALAQKFAASSLTTQDEQNAAIKSWGLGENAYTSSIEDYQAYNRQANAIHDAVNAMTAKMVFKSPQDEVDFAVKTEKGLLAALHKGDRSDLVSLLQDMPDEALAAATKSLDASEAKSADFDRLIKSLNDFLAASKSQNNAWRPKTNLIV